MGNAAILRYSMKSDMGRPSYLTQQRQVYGGFLMNLQAIETVVRRLFSDAEFRSQAIADPSAALAEYRLAASEQAALTKLCVQMANGAPVGDKQQLGFWL